MLSGRLKMEKIFRIKSLVSALVVVSGFMLTGCSSDGGSSVTSPNGIYTGNITGGNSTFNGLEEKAIIYNNRMMVLSNNLDGVSQLFDANLTDQTVSLAGTGKRYSGAGSGINTITYEGSYVAGTSASVDFVESVSNLTGTMVFNTTPSVYAKGSDLSRLSGTWSGIFVAGSNATMTLNIGSDGVIAVNSGDSGDGADCGFTGDFGLIEASVNVYAVNLISDGGGGGCFVSAGTYTGLAWTEGDTNGTLVLMAADGNRGRAVVLTKN